MTMQEINAALEAMTRLSRILMQQASAAKTITDSEVLSCRELLPAWEIGLSVSIDECYQYDGKVYRVRQAHTTQADWTPDVTPAMWAAIDVTHAGTTEDPIPASRGMDYVYGKYYRDPEDSKTYLCKRTGEEEGGTINLQYLPHELVGQYFEEVV